MVTLQMLSRPFIFATTLAGYNSCTACLKKQKICHYAYDKDMKLTGEIIEFESNLKDVSLEISPR